MKIVFIGLPGCGKTTQAKRLSKHLGISYISMRQLVQESNLVKSDSWQPLSDNLAVQICSKAIANKSSFILDGFPRNKEQYQGLNFEDSIIFFLLDISFSESESRILNRGDSDDVVATRLQLERDRFPELVGAIPEWDWTGKPSGLISVSGTQHTNEVTRQLIHYVELGK